MQNEQVYYYEIYNIVLLVFFVPIVNENENAHAWVVLK